MFRKSIVNLDGVSAPSNSPPTVSVFAANRVTSHLFCSRSTSLTLTLKKDEDYIGEIPDSDIVQEKIRKVDRILQISY